MTALFKEIVVQNNIERAISRFAETARMIKASSERRCWERTIDKTDSKVLCEPQRAGPAN